MNNGLSTWNKVGVSVGVVLVAVLLLVVGAFIGLWCLLKDFHPMSVQNMKDNNEPVKFDQNFLNKNLIFVDFDGALKQSVLPESK